MVNSKDYDGKENVKETFDSLPCNIKIIHPVRSVECQNHLREVGQNFRTSSGVNPELKHPVSGKCKNLLLKVGQPFRHDSGDNPVLNHPLNGKFQNHLLDVGQNFRPDSGVNQNANEMSIDSDYRIIFND